MPFYGLELLVGFVQALIFGGLTLIFLTVAAAGVLLGYIYREKIFQWMRHRHGDDKVEERRDRISL